MKKKARLLILLAVFGLVMLTSCDNADPEEAIVGTWVCHDTSAPCDFLCLLVFTADGRFTDNDGDDGDFTIAGDQLTITFDGPFYPLTMTFRIRGDRLTLTESGGRRELRRQ